MKSILVLTCAAFLLSFTSGCGDSKYNVKGKVAYQDGKAFNNGKVALKQEGGGVAYEATVDDDGAFEVSGVPQGNYKVAVVPRATPAGVKLHDPPPPVARKFTDFQTSELEVEVKRDVASFDITLTKK